MSKLETTISQLKDDLSPLEMSREEFLALCAKERLESRSQDYDKEFDKFLKALEVQEISNEDLNIMAESIKNFSDIVAVVYDSLIREIDLYQKNIFNKF